MRPRPAALAVAGVATLACASASASEIHHYDPRIAGAVATGPPPETGKLSGQWCGTPTSVDDTAHETGSRLAAKIKVIEAYAADQPAFEGRRGDIQATVMRAFDHVAAESGGARSLRFDLGTSCGAAYLDIQTIRFREPRAHFTGDACLDGLRGQVIEATEGVPGVRNYLVFAPEIECTYAGYAEVPNDDRPGAENRANHGNRVAMVFTMSWLTALHEVLHNLGAVNKSAPHNDPQTSHCWDDEDVMCYVGLFPVGAVDGLPVCDVSPPALDCNKDDYFNPSPPDGSYLDTHWNVWDSVFLCDLASCVPPAPPPPATVPAASPPAKPAATPKKKRKAAGKGCSKKKKARRGKRRCRSRRR